MFSADNPLASSLLSDIASFAASRYINIETDILDRRTTGSYILGWKDFILKR